MGRLIGPCSARAAKLLALALLQVTAFSATAAQQQAGAVSDPQTVLRDALRAMGGEPRLGRIKALTLEGNGVAFGYYGGRRATFLLETVAPDRLRVRIATNIYQLERVTDGAMTWERESWQGRAGAPLPHVRIAAPFVHARMTAYATPFPLLRLAHAGLRLRSGLGKTATGATAVSLEAVDEQGRVRETWLLDPDSHLPVERDVPVEFDLGAGVSRTVYSDYRKVQGLILPFKLVETSLDAPGAEDTIQVSRYVINAAAPEASSRYPFASRLGEPLQPSLRSLPSTIYKEHDQVTGDPAAQQFPRWASWQLPTETWYFDMILDEARGRWLEPVKAVILLYYGPQEVRRVELAAPEIATLRRLVVNRSSGLVGSAAFRHVITAPIALGVDRMTYELHLRAPDGRTTIARIDAPIKYVEQKNRFIFPVKGPFFIMGSHAWWEFGHNDEASQFGSFDVQPVGPRGEMLKDDKGTAQSFVAFGTPILAPADGIVVSAVGNMPNMAYDTGRMIALDNRTDGISPWEGNFITIDHGQGEFTFFCHLAAGSVLVKTGDHVTQGQVIARLGGSSPPEAWHMPAHLHFQVMHGPEFGLSDGVPSVFDNIEQLVFNGMPGAKVDAPRKGNFYIAR